MQVDLSDNYLGPQGAKAIASGIRDNGSMTECVLRQNHLGVEGWGTIFNTLRDCSSSKITTWNLSNEGLGPEIAKPLAEYLSVASSVTMLNLSSNMLSGIGGEYDDGSGKLRGTFNMEGITAIVDAISKSRSLASVDLSNNALCGVNRSGHGTFHLEGITAIADALSVCTSMTKVLAKGRA